VQDRPELEETRDADDEDRASGRPAVSLAMKIANSSRNSPTGVVLPGNRAAQMSFAPIRIVTRSTRCAIALGTCVLRSASRAPLTASLKARPAIAGFRARMRL
jgi:hypothetical protein